MSDRDDSNWTWLAFAALGWWLLATVLGACGLLFASWQIPWAVVVYCGLTTIASLFAFAAYGLDKWLAGARYGRRVPERMLHWLELMGGWAGALLAQQLFRHKTQKVAFGLLFWSIVAIHLVVIAYGAYLWAMGSDLPARPPAPSATSSSDAP